MAAGNLAKTSQCRRELDEDRARILEELQNQYPDVDPFALEEGLSGATAWGCGSADSYLPTNAYHAEAREKRDDVLAQEIAEAKMRSDNRAAIARFFSDAYETVASGLKGAGEATSEFVSDAQDEVADLIQGARTFFGI